MLECQEKISITGKHNYIWIFVKFKKHSLASILLTCNAVFFIQSSKTLYLSFRFVIFAI